MAEFLVLFATVVLLYGAVVLIERTARGRRPAPRRMALDLSEDDWLSIQDAIAIQQETRLVHKGRGNVAGRALAEVCDEWLIQRDRIDLLESRLRKGC